MGFRFAIPDLLFEEELTNLGRYGKQDLPDFGLSVEYLDPEGVAIAEDHRMRDCANEHGPHHGVLWVIDKMLAAALLSVAEVTATLEAMGADRKCLVIR